LEAVLVVGTRPQIIKSAPIVKAAAGKLDLSIINTGQHYDYEMSKIFFSEFDLPNPIADLGVGSGSPSEQIAAVIIRLERLLASRRPRLVVVPGDTNSALGSAIAGVKLNIPVAHVEAGARSYDFDLPEEVNRRLIDHCSAVAFAPSANCGSNLVKEGIEKKRIRVVGDTMFDGLLANLTSARTGGALRRLGLEPQTYAFVTLHRNHNVDDEDNLRSIVKALIRAQELRILFPVHPRTKARLRQFSLLERLARAEHITLTQPFGYIETIQIVENARLVLTDSGGLQKEAFWLGTPCITLRDSTEWVETIRAGGNMLVGHDTKKIERAIRRFNLDSQKVRTRLRNMRNPFGNGKASQKIVKILGESQR